MTITELRTGEKLTVAIRPVTAEDFKKITVKSYFFNWKKLKDQPLLLKLQVARSSDILGLIHLEDFPAESRIEIGLLAVSAENRGRGKQFEGIAGCLIAYAARMALARYGEYACISLVPKTKLKPYYIKKYKMTDAGWQIYLDGHSLRNLLKLYNA